MALATVATVKSRLGLTTTQHDTLLTSIVDAVSLAIARYCHRAAGATSLLERQASRTVRFDGGGQHILLDCYPVESITSVKEAFDNGFDDADALTAETDYYVEARSGLLWRMPTGATWLRGRGVVQVVWTGGYVAAGDTPGDGQVAVPYDLAEACVMQSGHLFSNRDKLGQSSISMGGMSVSLVEGNWLPLVRSLMAPFRRMV